MAATSRRSFRLRVRLKGPRKLCLVTDANRALDLPPGNYRFGAAEDGSWFESDGRVGWAPGRTSLASSIVGMDHMVRQMKRDTSASIPDVVRAWLVSLPPNSQASQITRVASKRKECRRSSFEPKT